MMVWTPEMSVGVALIDRQHQEFVGLINELAESTKTGRAQVTTGLVLMKLDSYARYHFSTEEEYFAVFNFEGAEEHILAHRQLSKRLTDFIDRFYNRNETITEDLAVFLMEWLENHLKTMDRKYTRCFNEHGLY